VAFPVDEAYFLVVADGIGGAAFGDVASKLALKTILELSSRATSWVMKFTDLDAQDLRQRIDAYIEQIQERFRECNHVDPRLRGMGTTLTCACVLPAHAVFVQIGDSRAYLHRGGELSQLTRDQTLAQDLVDKGAVPTDVKKFGHMLTNSLGGDNGPVEAEVIHLDLLAGDRIMLCSDGLSDMVDDTEIADILKMDELQPACDRLVQSALDHGGKDNITVVLCDLKNPQNL
jgi:protein phosphatase